jgi:hypothetical protein
MNKDKNLLLTHLWVGDTQEELLLLGGLGGRQVGGQKLFESVRNSVGSDILNVFKSLLSSGKWLIGGELDHLRESLQRANGLLDLAKLASSGIEFFLFEKAVA